MQWFEIQRRCFVLDIIWKDYITKRKKHSQNQMREKRKHEQKESHEHNGGDEEWAVVPFADSMTWVRRKIVFSARRCYGVGGIGNDDDGCSFSIVHATRDVRQQYHQIITHCSYLLCSMRDSNNIRFESHEITTQKRYSIMCQIEITARNDTAEFSIWSTSEFVAIRRAREYLESTRLSHWQPSGACERRRMHQFVHNE